ncbi:MAG: hypothetical protein FWD69_02495 [Polyangiaceae bacterium]|nr:hypothetical protein [Polyangiaceae bacterium]
MSDVPVVIVLDTCNYNAMPRFWWCRGSAIGLHPQIMGIEIGNHTLPT